MNKNEQKNLVMFANVDDCVKTYKTKEQLAKIVIVTIENHLTMLTKNFKRYFLEDDNLVTSYEWVKNSFKNTQGLSTAEEGIGFTANGEIKKTILY